MYREELVTKERLDALRVKRRAMQDEKFLEIERLYGTETADAFRYLYGMYDERIYLWLANLWDPEIGAFYYSNSARDTDGYLPDIESTCQAISFLQNTGIYSCFEGTHDKYTPDFMKKKIIDFVIGLQDPDGYFYHPQWKNAGTTRRSRDLTWCTDTLMTMGGKARYVTPLDRSAESAKELLPDHLKSIEAFKTYLSEQPITEQSYYIGNLMSAQMKQILAAGEEFTDALISWLNEKQCPENGLWNPTLSYHSTNGLMKITMCYTAAHKPLPNADKALDCCIKIVCLKQNNPQATSHYNPWTTIGMIINNVTEFGGREKADELRARLISNLPEMIRTTADKISIFKRADGSFSYKPTGSSWHTQGAPAAVLDSDEGDVNGNSLASSGIAGCLCRALGLERIPFYTPDDGRLFFELIESSYQAKKLYPRPEKMYPDT